MQDRLKNLQEFYKDRTFFWRTVKEGIVKKVQFNLNNEIERTWDGGCCFDLVCLLLLSQGLPMWPRLIPNSSSSCLSFPNVEITERLPRWAWDKALNLLSSGSHFTVYTDIKSSFMKSLVIISWQQYKICCISYYRNIFKSMLHWFLKCCE